MLRSLTGHWFTVAPFARHLIAPRRVPDSRAFDVAIDDPRFGRIQLSGLLHAPGHARALLVVVHGLGGSAESHYVQDAVAATLDAGLACLRVNLRGADLSGDDFYHAGLSTDLSEIIAAPALARFESIGVLGYSLGGHVSLRLATESRDPRVRAVAAVCAPLDLDRSASEIDLGRRWVYRRHVLSGLREMYAAFCARRRPDVPLSVAAGIRTIRQWDDRIVAPRHGFESAEDYYAKASVAPRLAALELPALLVQAEHDPMVPAYSVRPALERASRSLEVRFVDDGGHVGFPEAVDLGVPAPLGLESQIVGWLTQQF
jgi:hypothetical protein